YSKDLAAHPQIVVGSKAELPGTEARRGQLEGFCAGQGLPFHAISSATGLGSGPRWARARHRRHPGESFMGPRRGLTRVRRLVVKVGSGQIASPSEGLDARRISALAADIAELVGEGREVVLVSSGAIVAGGGRPRPVQCR